MASIKDAIYSKLAGTTAITAIVGTRVYRLKMPDNPTLPALTYEVSFGEEVESRDGYSALSNPVVSVHCWARTQAAADALAQAVHDAVVGQSWTYSDRAVGKVLEWSSVDLYDSDTDTYHVACSFRVWYT